MTVEATKKNHQNQHHHHKHHHHHTHKKLVNLKSIERITNLPVVESAHAYYEKIKNSNMLIKWSLFPAETGVWLAVGTAMPVINYFETPVTAIDSIVCHGLDVIEANLPMIKYPPDLVYNITKDYVNSKVVTPMLKRADSVKQLSLHGANNFGGIAADRLNNAIDVADKYVEKYLPDISDATDSSTSEEDSEGSRGNSPTQMPFEKTSPKIRTSNGVNEKWKDFKIKRLHVFSDKHGQLLADKLKKKFPAEIDVFVNVTPGASSSYIVQRAIEGAPTFTREDVVVLISGMEDVAIGRNSKAVYSEFLNSVNAFANNMTTTFAIVCPIFPQYDLPLEGTVNKTIESVNIELENNLSYKEHVCTLDISPLLRRKFFSKSGLYLTSKGKGLLACLIRAAVRNINSELNDSPSVMVNPNSKRAKTIQHVNQFGRKLQRRLTRRTIAEAKALKQQGADTIRCLVYLVDLLARDPQMFMEKAKQMWVELSKDEPENQVPPANLEQLIAMLTRELARRVVHVTNYTGAKVVLLSHYGVHAAHIGALNLIWWADYLIKMMHLETAVEKTAEQVTRMHHVSVELVERLVELIRNLKMESMRSTENNSAGSQVQSALQQLALPAPQTQLPSTPQQGPRTSSVSSVASTTSFTSSSSSTATIGNKVPPSQNGDTHNVQTNHETVFS